MLRWVKLYFTAPSAIVAPKAQIEMVHDVADEVWTYNRCRARLTLSCRPHTLPKYVDEEIIRDP